MSPLLLVVLSIVIMVIAVLQENFGMEINVLNVVVIMTVYLINSVCRMNVLMLVSMGILTVGK